MKVLDKNMLNRKAFFIFFATYLGLCPVFWMPNVPPAFFTLTKYSLFIYISLYSILYTYKNSNSFVIRFPGGYFTLLALLIMFIIVLPIFLLGDNSESLNAIVNLLQTIIFLIATRVIIDCRKVSFVIKIASIILSIFVIASVVLMLAMPFTPNPFNENLTLLDTGFSGARTGWTPSIGIFIPLVLIFYPSVIVLFVYLFSQMLTGGRAGFYFSVLSVPALLFFDKSSGIKKRFILLSVIVFIILYFYDPSYFEGFRVFDSLSNTENMDVDDLSSGRLTRMYDAWSSILKSPFLGNAMYASFSGDNVHNVFMKGWVFYGFLYFLCSISIVCYAIIKALQKIYYSNNYFDRKFFIASFTVLMFGVLVGFVEPAIIFGNFTTFSVWWFIFALVTSSNFRLSKELD